MGSRSYPSCVSKKLRCQSSNTNNKALVLIVDGLMATGQVNNAQPPHPQPHRTLGVNPFIVRAAMDDRLANAPDGFGFHTNVGLGAYDACYAAHDSSLNCIQIERDLVRNTGTRMFIDNLHEFALRC